MPGTAGLSPAAAVPGLTVILVAPFLITRSALPSPAISFIPVRFSANSTVNPSCDVLRFTLMLFVLSASRLKVPAPWIFTAVPKLRCTLPVASASSLP